LKRASRVWLTNTKKKKQGTHQKPVRSIGVWINGLPRRGPYNKKKKIRTKPRKRKRVHRETKNPQYSKKKKGGKEKREGVLKKILKPEEKKREGGAGGGGGVEEKREKDEELTAIWP